MKYILIILVFYSTNISAETCKWWFQRYGWKNFDLSQVEVCLKNGSPVVADIEGGESPLHIAAEVNEDPEVLLRLIRAGAIGAKHEFYDSLQGSSEAISFNATTDVFNVLTNNDYFSSDQNEYKHAPGLKIDDEFIDDYNSVVHSQISSSGAYKGNNTEFRTLYESEEASGHMKKIVGKSLKNFMTKAPINIGVSGRDFIQGNPSPQGDQHYTIGNTIRVLFFDSTADLDARPKLDTKKSGDYIIFAARHMLKVEKYDVQLLCTKLADYKEDVKVM